MALFVSTKAHFKSCDLYFTEILLIGVNVHPITCKQSIFFQLMYFAFSPPIIENNALAMCLNYMKLMLFNHF